MVASIPPKKVVNADTGTADLVGGDDWDKLNDWMNDVDTTGPVKFNTETRFRSGKLKWRDTGDDHNYTHIFNNLAANRNVTWPLLAADDQVTFDAHTTSLTNKTIDVQTNALKLRNYTYLIYKNGSTYYSQKDDGTINSNSAFSTVLQAIIDSIATRDDTVRTIIKIAPGDYDVNTTITIADKYNLSIEGSGMGITRIRAGAILGSSRILDIKGSVSGVGKNLTSNAVSKQKTAVMSSGDASTFAVDDWVLIRSSLNFGTGGAADGGQGEIKQIASIASGTITFREMLYDTYNTANTANIIKLLPCRNLSFSNFTLDRHASYSPGGSVKWWYMFFIDRIDVNKCEVVDFPGQFRGAMCFHSCTNIKVSDCHMQQNIAYNFQYGISFHGACQGCTITNCTAYGDWRHPFEAGAGEIGTNEEGVCRNIVFTGCTATGGSQNCFDTHPEGEGIHFVNCTVLGTNDGGGIKLRSRYSSAVGCKIQGVTQVASGQHAIMISDDAPDCLISGCVIIETTGADGIKIKDGLDGTTVTGCFISNCSGDGIHIDTGGANRTMIRDNNIIGNGGDGIEGLDVDNMIISGNRISTNTAWGINFEAATCTNNVIVANSFNGNGSGAVNNGGQTGEVKTGNFGY